LLTDSLGFLNPPLLQAAKRYKILNKMENKESNKFTFGLGIFFVVMYGISIFFNGFAIKTSLFFAFGIYLVWQNGFIRDTSTWKYKPMKIIVICSAATICILIFLFMLRIQNSKSTESSKINMVRELVYKAKEKLPMDLGNGDSLIDVIAVNENTLKYEYKIQYSIDSIRLQELEAEYKKSLNDRFKSFDNNTINQWRKSKISFSHEFKDRDGKFAFNIIIKSGEY
jgi:hypothetical protein